MRLYPSGYGSSSSVLCLGGENAGIARGNCARCGSERDSAFCFGLADAGLCAASAIERLRTAPDVTKIHDAGRA